MNFTVQSSALKKALEIAGHAQTGRHKMPILSNAYVRVWKEKITVCCDSLDARVEVDLEPDATGESFFSFCASPRLMTSAMRGDTASFTLDDGRLLIKSNGDSKLLTADPKEFPKPWPEIESGPVDGKALIAALKQCCHCSNGAHGKGMIFWSKDTRHVVGASSVSVSMQSVPMDLPSFLAPSTLGRIVNSVFDWEQDIAIGVLEHDLYLEQGVVRAWLKLHEGRMFDHRPLLGEVPVGVTLEREALINALESMTAFVDPDFQRVTFTPKKGPWIVSTISINGESEIELDVGLPIAEVEPFTVSLSGFLDSMKFWTCDTLTLHRSPNFITLRPQDESGAISILNLIRN